MTVTSRSGLRGLRHGGEIKDPQSEMSRRPAARLLASLVRISHRGERSCRFATQAKHENRPSPLWGESAARERRARGLPRSVTVKN